MINCNTLYVSQGLCALRSCENLYGIWEYSDARVLDPSWLSNTNNHKELWKSYEARVFDPFKMYNTKYLCYTPDLCFPSKTMILWDLFHKYAICSVYVSERTAVIKPRSLIK